MDSCAKGSSESGVANWSQALPEVWATLALAYSYSTQICSFYANRIIFLRGKSKVKVTLDGRIILRLIFRKLEWGVGTG
jgi:hypothetical protein